jgi:hypothetical protein
MQSDKLSAIDPKAIAAGVGAALVANLAFALLLAPYLASLVLRDRSIIGDFANMGEAARLLGLVSLHPAASILAAVSTCAAAGIPAYLSALLARKRFVLHSMLIGGFISAFILADWDTVLAFPLLVSLIVAATLTSTFLAGSFRKAQIRREAV